MTRYNDLSRTVKVKHRLDIKYPHICFCCKKDLYWMELLNVNRFFNGNGDEIDKKLKKLKKLWKSKVIQFFCCNCFSDIEKDKFILDVEELFD